MMASSTLLQLHSLTARLGVVKTHSFGPFCLSIQQGERIAILGPSGAGKSTLLKLMSRELIPASGHGVFGDQRLSQWDLQKLSQCRAVLPQSGEVAFGFDAHLVIKLGRVARTHDSLLNQIVIEAARLAHADHLLQRRFDTLSGGEQARVQLARVFAQLWDVHNGLILVDEPLASLDPGLQCELLDSLIGYASERHHAVVAVLHDINQAMSGFDRLLLIKHGKLINDLPCSVSVIPELEALYGISLSCVLDEQGNPVISPLRKSIHRAKPILV